MEVVNYLNTELINELDKVLIPLGFVRRDDFYLSYIKLFGEIQLILNVDKNNSDKIISISNYSLIIPQVERCLYLLTEIPDVDNLKSLRKGEEYLVTIQDNTSDLYQFTVSHPIANKEDITLWKTHLEDYIHGQGKFWLGVNRSIAKINHSYSRFLLEENNVIDLFETNPLDLIRILIFSRLTLDGLFDHKFDLVQEFMASSNKWCNCFAEFEELIIPKIKPLNRKEELALIIV